MVPSVLASSVCWSLQCLISALAQGDGGRHFLGSLVQSCCGEGGTLQTSNTGMCSQCLSHSGPAHSRRVCPPCPHCSGSRLLHREPSEASPGLHAPPRSKLLRFRHSGSPQRRRLGRACVLCPSQVWAAQVMRCLVSVVAATYRLPRPCRSVFWVYNQRTFAGGCPEPQEVLAKKPACSSVENVSLGLRLPPSGSGCLSPEGDGLQLARYVQSFVL